MNNNLNIIKNAINAKNKALDSKVEAFCIVCANEAYAWLETNKKEWKNDTYNLIDSTGIAVYKEGTLQSFLALRPKKAISLRRITYHKKKIYVDGRALLESAISAYNSNNTYYEFILFSTADYAAAVEAGGASGINRGKDWFNKLSIHLKSFKENYKWN